MTIWNWSAERIGDTLSLSISGDLRARAADMLVDNASMLFEGQPATRAVTLDLSGIEAMNRQGVGSVMALVAYLMKQGVTITLTGLRGQALLRLEEVSAWLALSREGDSAVAPESSHERAD